MNVDSLIRKIENHPEFDRVGMILTHTGIVRGFSRSGEKVSMVEMTVDWGELEKVVQKHEAMPGIVSVEVEISRSAKLFPGERIMVIALAGDIRENVLGVMTSLIDAIKKNVTHKTEHSPDREAGG